MSSLIDAVLYSCLILLKLQGSIIHRLYYGAKTEHPDKGHEDQGYWNLI